MLGYSVGFLNTHVRITNITPIGSSKGRGTRCSGWFADFLQDKGETELQSLTLEGGIKGWVKAGEKFTQEVDGYEPEYWKQFD